MTVFDIKTWGDVRAFIHVAFPGVAGFLVALGVLSGSLAPLVVALVLAVADPALSFVNTVDGFRKWLYPVLGAGSALAIAVGIGTAATWAPWLALVPIFIGGGVAAANTSTSG